MSNKKITIVLAVLAGFALTQFATATSISGSLSTNGSTNAAKDKSTDIGQNALSKIKDRGNKEIDRRIESLNKLIERVQSMKRVDDSMKIEFAAQLQAQIDSLTALKAKIESGTSASTTLENEKKITKEHRIYALVIPQGYIAAAIDRISNMAKKLQGLSDKLAAKTADLQTAGKNTTKLQESIADMNAKITNAKTQAAAAQAKVENLKPDNGDAAIGKSNQEALVVAKNLIKTATKDLNYARNAANTIAKELRKLGIKTNVGLGNASTTTAITTNATTSASTTMGL